MTSDEFLRALGYRNPQFHMRDYIENHLTMDCEFYTFADRYREKYRYALLSNDVLAWSDYITEYYGLNRYFTHKIISAGVHCRKPESKIFEIALERLAIPAVECIFIDNSVANLKTAQKVGMDTILFNRDNEEYSGATVYSFEELARIV